MGVHSNAVSGTTTVHVSDSVASGNTYGFYSSYNSGAVASRMFVTRSVATENSFAGFVAASGVASLMVVGESLATNNGTYGFFNNNSSTFQSRGNNTVAGNPFDAVGVTTLPGL